MAQVEETGGLQMTRGPEVPVSESTLRAGKFVELTIFKLQLHFNLSNSSERIELGARASSETVRMTADFRKALACCSPVRNSGEQNPLKCWPVYVNSIRAKVVWKEET